LPAIAQVPLMSVFVTEFTEAGDDRFDAQMYGRNAPPTVACPVPPATMQNTTIQQARIELPRLMENNIDASIDCLNKLKAAIAAEINSRAH
jgi:hypothetical protein